MRVFSSLLGYLQRKGFTRSIRQIYVFMKRQKKAKKMIRIGWDRQRLAAERQIADKIETRISVFVSISNASVRNVRAMIESVRNQSYMQWELCIVDQNADAHETLSQVCQKYAQEDNRIRYVRTSASINRCISTAEGTYIALLDQNDILHPSALYEVARTVSNTGADMLYTDECTFRGPQLAFIQAFYLKPDFAPDNLKAWNYIGHLIAFDKKLFTQVGEYRLEYGNSCYYDLILRLARHANKIEHIPQMLYFRRASSAVDGGHDAVEEAKKAVLDSIRFQENEAQIESTAADSAVLRVRYALKEQPQVDILIPNKNCSQMLDACVRSILDKTSYPNYRVLILDNGSDTEETWKEYESLRTTGRVQIISCDMPFNFSRLVNIGAMAATGDYLLLLNNDTRIISNEWIEEMMMYAQRDDVGAVGALLLFPDGTIQHAGIALGLGEDRCAGHVYYGYRSESYGIAGRMCYAQNVSAVTAACMLVRKEHYLEVGGFDESFPLAYNDVDFCMKLRTAGYVNVWTPFARLYHDESHSRGRDVSPEKKERLQREARRMRERWSLNMDPYFQRDELSDW